MPRGKDFLSDCTLESMMNKTWEAMSDNDLCSEEDTSVEEKTDSGGSEFEGFEIDSEGSETVDSDVEQKSRKRQKLLSTPNKGGSRQLKAKWSVSPVTADRTTTTLTAQREYPSTSQSQPRPSASYRACESAADQEPSTHASSQMHLATTPHQGHRRGRILRGGGRGLLATVLAFIQFACVHNISFFP